MDKTVPKAAASILDFISGPESGGDYEAISSYKQGLLPKKITSMTVSELLVDMQTWRRKYKTLSSAAGRYQIIYKTLVNLVKVMGLTGKEKFSPDLQDRMGYQLLRFRGYDNFVAGNLSVQEFGKALAQEWASMPVLAGTKNYKGQNIPRGTSYYAGDGLNSHGVSAAAFERALQTKQIKPVNSQRGVSDLKEPVPAVIAESVLEKAQTLQPSVNVPAPPSGSTVATTVGTAVATGAVVVGGAADAAKSVTDWGPVIDLATGVTKYGPWVAGLIVVAVVAVIIGKRIWKG